MRLPTMMMYYKLMLSSPSYKQLLDDNNRVWRDRHIPRPALKIYRYSLFNYLYLSGNDEALLNATGHTHKLFDLLENFKTYYQLYTFDDEIRILRRKKLQEIGRQCGRK